MVPILPGMCTCERKGSGCLRLTGQAKGVRVPTNVDVHAVALGRASARSFVTLSMRSTRAIGWRGINGCVQSQVGTWSRPVHSPAGRTHVTTPAIATGSSATRKYVDIVCESIGGKAKALTNAESNFRRSAVRYMHQKTWTVADFVNQGSTAAVVRSASKNAFGGHHGVPRGAGVPRREKSKQRRPGRFGGG